MAAKSAELRGCYWCCFLLVACGIPQRHPQPFLTLTSSVAVAKISLAHSTMRLIATGWKLYFPSAFFAMCTNTGARPIKKQSAATSHTCKGSVACGLL
jgi:hypothetical protein